MCVNVLIIDVGGTHVRVLASGERTPRKFASGPKLTARQMVSGAKSVARDLNHDAVAIGYPPDDIVVGGGNVKKLKMLPPGCRAGDNANAWTTGVERIGGSSAVDAPTRRDPNSSAESTPLPSKRDRGT